MGTMRKGGFGPNTPRRGRGNGRGPTMGKPSYPTTPKAPTRPTTPAKKPIDDSGMYPKRSSGGDTTAGRQVQTSTPVARSAAMTTGKPTGPSMPKRGFKPGSKPSGSGKPTGSGPGFVRNYGGDKHEYLGHFRSMENVKRGHNVGAPKPKLPGEKDAMKNPSMKGTLKKIPPSRIGAGASIEPGGGFRKSKTPKTAESIGKKAARRVLSGKQSISGVSAADVAEQRPVIAARQAARVGGVKPGSKQMRGIAQAARKFNPESGFNEKNALRDSTVALRKQRTSLRDATRGRDRKNPGLASLV